MIAADYVILAGLGLGWVLLGRAPRLPRRHVPTDAPLTIVIPARNEALRLPGLLSSLLPGLPPTVRVVVVDDHSADATRAVAGTAERVTVLAAPPMPDGWLGKSWACHVGAAGAPAGDLVFVDADVRLDAEALGRARTARAERGGLLSVWPYHLVERPYEQLSALPSVITLMTVRRGGPFSTRASSALGPVLLTTTEDYARAGGHESVRGVVVEDLALGRRYVRAGLPVSIVAGDPAIRFRMYGEGLRTLLQGWQRNFRGGARAVPFLRLAAVIGWLVSSLGLFTWGGGLSRSITPVYASLFAVQMAVTMRQLGQFGLWNGLLYPLHVLFVAGLFGWSLWSAACGRRVTWRGRSVGSAGD